MCMIICGNNDIINDINDNDIIIININDNVY